MARWQIAILVMAAFVLGLVAAWNIGVEEQTKRQLISSGSPWEELAAYSRAVVVGDSIFISGTVGSNPDSGEIPDGAKAQTEVIFQILETTLTRAGASFSDLVRLRICLVDAEDIDVVAEVLRSWLSDVRRPGQQAYSCRVRLCSIPQPYLERAST